MCKHQIMQKRRDLIGTAEAARILGKHRSTITRWVKRDLIRAEFRSDGDTGPMFFRRSDVEALLKGQAA